MKHVWLSVVFCISLWSLINAEIYYWHFTGEDAPMQDYLYLPNTTIATLEAACSASPECVGFNSDGFLKNATENMQPAPCDFYLKQSVPAPSVHPFLVPMPQSAKLGSTVVGLGSSLTFSANEQDADLSAAFSRYQTLIFTHPVSSRAKKYSVNLQAVKVIVANFNVSLQFGVNESYSLYIPDDGSSAVITAETVYGAYRALETLSQLIVYNFVAHSYQISVAPVMITDFPRFPHRGLLIDTSRHWEPVSSLFSLIDSLSYAKMNTLHWHIVDSQSFPLESLTYPYLWNGSYTEMERYTQEDVAAVVEYARQRGVRVMMEFDMPGHAASWCVGYPEVCPSATCTQPLNPATNATFDLITSLLGEVTGYKTGAGLVPEDFLHLGGDEVDETCWNTTATIKTWMTENNLTTDQTYMYFVLRAHKIAIAQGRTPVNWEEVFDHFGTQLDKRSVIHIWLSSSTLKKVVSAGYRAIFSSSSVWYLDNGARTWEDMYMEEPFFNITDPAQQALVLGGEGCMWGETVDASDMHQTIWPRAAAIAERLWSSVNMNMTAEFLPRLENFRCILNKRGIPAAPTNNLIYRSSPPYPGSCYSQ